MLKVSNVKVVVYKGEDPRLKGFASITIEDSVAVHGIKIIEGLEGGLFISMPSRKHKDKHIDIVHPTNKQARAAIEEVVLETYKKEVEISTDG